MDKEQEEKLEKDLMAFLRGGRTAKAIAIWSVLSGILTAAKIAWWIICTAWNNLF